MSKSLWAALCTIILLGLIFCLPSSDTVKNQLALAANIGTFFAALTALLTLFEMSRQRKLSQHPEIIFTNARFIASTDPISANTKVLTAWHVLTRDTSTGKLEKSNDKNLKLSIYNVGNNLAKNVQIEWDFSYRTLIKSIRSLYTELGENEKIGINGGFLQVKGGAAVSASINLRSDLKQETPFILVADHDTCPVPCRVPYSYVYLVSKCISLEMEKFSRSKKTTFSGFCVPPLYCKITYLNIEGQTFTSVCKFVVDISTYSSTFFEAELKAVSTPQA